MYNSRSKKKKKKFYNYEVQHGSYRIFWEKIKDFFSRITLSEDL